MNLIEIPKIDNFIVQAVEQYSSSCPQLTEYLEDLYLRVNSGEKGVDLQEIRFIGTLKEKDRDAANWATPPLARNMFHHFAHSFGIADKWPLIADA